MSKYRDRPTQFLHSLAIGQTVATSGDYMFTFQADSNQAYNMLK